MKFPTDPLVTVTRDGVVESVHLGEVVVATPDGAVTALVGDPDRLIYPRSALKPFQAVAVLEQLTDLGQAVEEDQLAVFCASHDGADEPQIVAASVLAEAGLDESALRCPPDWPIADRVTADLTAKTTLSHNCSGKHAAMLWAHTAAGHDPATYLDVGTVLQARIARRLADVLNEPPKGPGIDGCGAPAWVVPIGGLATGFARLVAGTDPVLARTRDAMSAFPELVGGATLPDTAMMRTDSRVVAKRGADGVMGAGFVHPRIGPVGVAVKIADGGDRAAGPATAAVLEALGANVPGHVRRAAVLGGGVPHGEIVAVPALSALVTDTYGLA